MRKAFLFVIISSCFYTSNAQDTSFHEIADSYLLHLFTGKPDSVIIPFLKHHFPYLIKKDEGTTWTMYPSENPPKPLKGIHAVKFSQHPFLKAKHQAVRLDILTNEYGEILPGIITVRIWFYFENDKDAEAAIKEIRERFEKKGASIKITNSDMMESALIKDPGNDYVFSGRFQIILTKDKDTNKPMVGFLFDGDDGKW